jgi:hypothetical protein
MWSALALLPMLLGSSTAVPQGSICAQTGPDIRAIIANGEVHVAPEVKALLLDVIGGKREKIAADVQQVRSKFHGRLATEWLNLALFQATYYNRAGTAEQLIGQGADVNAHPLNLAFADSPSPGEDQRVWPAIEQAADCGNTAALKVLLAHHADMYTSLREPRPEPGTLLLAILGGHEDTVAALLDHGYDPCLVYANYHPGPGRLTAVELAMRRGFSAALVRQLEAASTGCSAPAPARSAAAH